MVINEQTHLNASLTVGLHLLVLLVFLPIVFTPAFSTAFDDLAKVHPRRSW